MIRPILAVLAGLASPSHAEPVRFDDLDINVDGRLELSELELAFGPRAHDLLAALDANCDGAISAQEVRRSALAPRPAAGAARPFTRAQ